jgi:hypothetical protein
MGEMSPAVNPVSARPVISSPARAAIVARHSPTTAKASANPTHSVIGGFSGANSRLSIPLIDWFAV